ncbi:MAG TPA: tRNA preQ1(34) S-adenosylmethionine ribosyltransferase-isomerase QueA [Armatimonadota bacterium]|nr:tRNA preQ1(34) S-adenosylmethionine ribosyltransferase-isomerase QueA [Armatimonadota bacterium]
MRLSDFEYDLPPELIAQSPVRPRDHSRLLVLDRRTGAIQHRRFRDLPDYLRADDVAVFNDTRVIPARLRGRREPSGGAVEALLLRELEPGIWEALVRPGRRVRVGDELRFGDELRARVLALYAGAMERAAGGRRRLAFSSPGELDQALERAGEVPLPPYVHRPPERADDYQTIYARRRGSSAAPTAGLHFTPRMMRALEQRGAGMAWVTLHIGLGTFRPIREQEVERHEMHSEWCSVPAAAIEAVAEARGRGGRCVAVGTTTARALETAARGGELQAFDGETDLFIMPGYGFRVVDVLLTNFHLPRSTLLVLVCAFAGRAHTLAAYREAVREGYRFLSFGDAMLVT